MSNPSQASSSAEDSSASFSRKNQAFAQLIETLLHAALKLDAYQGSEVYALAPAALKLHFQPIPAPVYVLLTEQGLGVQSHLQGTADAEISANLSDWSALNSFIEDLDPATLNHETFKQFNIQGNTQLGQQFLQALQRLELDWEEKLSHYTGDLIAHQFGHRFRQWQGYKKSTGRQFLQMFEEYLQHEIRVGPSQHAFSDWKNQVQAIAQQTEQLIARAEQHLQPRQDSQSGLQNNSRNESRNASQENSPK